MNLTALLQEVDLIEHFSGVGMLTRVFREDGYVAAEVDKIHGKGHDILTDSGLGRLTFI